MDKAYPPFNLGILKQGYVLAVKRNPNPLKDLLGWMIYREQLSRGFTEEQANFTHVEILGPDEWSVKIQPPRAKCIDVTKVYKDRFVRMMKPKIDHYDIYKDKVSWWAATDCGKIYDYLGVLKFKFPKVLQMKHSPFCSEGMILAVRKEFPDFIERIKSWECMPAHSQGKDFDLIWEGYVT